MGDVLLPARDWFKMYLMRMPTSDHISQWVIPGGTSKESLGPQDILENLGRGKEESVDCGMLS